jgi:hypothetical protein
MAVSQEYRVVMNAGLAAADATNRPGDPQASGAGLRWVRQSDPSCAGCVHIEAPPQAATPELTAE